ncbi:MAG TPA: hypothetical protein VF622_17965 [Segetibacter sp.]|jgi:hypothetical protein
MPTHTQTIFEVDALQYDGTNAESLIAFSGKVVQLGSDIIVVNDEVISSTEWIIKDVSGNVYKKSNTEFTAAFTEIEEPET